MEKNRQFVVAVDKADGNETVGTSWVEHYIFDGGTTIDGIMERLYQKGVDRLDHTYERITLTLAHPKKASQ